MKKLFTLLCAMVGFASFAQNGKLEVLTAPNSSTPYILVDTLFTLEDTSITTDIYIHFANPTANDIKAIQFRLFYDNTKFSNAQMYWGPTATPVADKYGSYFLSGDYINVIATYTGTSSTFNWADGAMFKLRLTHGAAYQGVVDSMAIAGSTSYSNLATTGNGTDVTLGMYNYGGNFQMQPNTFPVHARNMDGTDAQGVYFTALKRLKTDSGNWTTIYTDSTDSDGMITFSHPIDTAFWHLRLTAQTDTMTDGSAISIVDAYKLANAASMQDTLTGVELYEGDINESGTATISDAFAVFNRLALGTGNWNQLFTGIYNVAVLWPSEYQAAVTATSIPTWAQAPRVYTIDTIVNSLSTIEPYIYVIGDATTTGYNNPAVLVGKMANPGSGTDYILDPAVYMSNKPDSIEFRIPKLTLAADNYMDVPVTMYTFGNKVGAAQMGIEYDTAIFEFESITVGDAAAKWTSLLSVESGRVFWAGHEDKMNPSVIESMNNAFTFRFKVKSILGWRTSPLKIVDKFAGDENAYDLSVRPSPNDGSVINGKADLDPKTLEMMVGFIVYPNPVTAITDHWVIFDFYTEDFSPLTAMVFNQEGILVKTYQDNITDTGFQTRGFYMGTYLQEYTS